MAHKAAVAVSEAAEHVAERQSRASFVARQVQAVALGRAEARWEEQRRAHGWSRCAGVAVRGEARRSRCAGRRGCRGEARLSRGGASLAGVRSRCEGRRGGRGGRGARGGAAVAVRSALRRSVGGESGGNSDCGVGPGLRFCEREERVVLRKSEFKRGKMFILNGQKKFAHLTTVLEEPSWIH